MLKYIVSCPWIAVYGCHLASGYIPIHCHECNENYVITVSSKIDPTVSPTTNPTLIPTVQAAFVHGLRI